MQAHTPLPPSYTYTHTQHTHTELLDSRLLYLATVGVLRFKSFAINALSDLM